jgi:hypothetical protein
MALTKVASAMLDIASYSAADIANKASAVNTVGKYAGLFIWDSTNNRLMRANGSTDVSVWWVVDGSTSVTPA